MTFGLKFNKKLHQKSSNFILFFYTFLIFAFAISTVIFEHFMKKAGLKLIPKKENFKVFLFAVPLFMSISILFVASCDFLFGIKMRFEMVKKSSKIDSKNLSKFQLQLYEIVSNFNEIFGTTLVFAFSSGTILFTFAIYEFYLAYVNHDEDPRQLWFCIYINSQNIYAIFSYLSIFFYAQNLKKEANEIVKKFCDIKNISKRKTLLLYQVGHCQIFVESSSTKIDWKLMFYVSLI